MTADEEGSGARAARGGPRRRPRAGTTAALRLAEAGVETTLVETRPRLGGLAFSFRRDSAAGPLTVDNGQHVYLRCCTAYRWYLDRVGAGGLAPLQDRLDVPVLDVGAPRPRLARLRRAALPPYRCIWPRAWPVPAPLGRRTRRRRPVRRSPSRDSTRTTPPWTPSTSAPGCTGTASPRVPSKRSGTWWGPATLNARAPQASLGLAAKVFRTGLLSDPGAADIGWAHVPLGDIHDGRARAALDAAGVRTLLRTRARAVDPAPPPRTAAGGSPSTGAAAGPRS